MIHRQKNYDSPPIGLSDPKWDKLKENLLIEKSRHKVKSECYRDQTIDELSSLYDNKCAICERERGTELQVDHYRPKKPRTNGDVRYRHDGYFWLAYTWSNLIPLCSKCNNKKSTKFPLKNYDTSKKVQHSDHNALLYDPLWLYEKEEPLLINPEIELDPVKHLQFLPNGKILGRTEEGKETILVCDLNRRDLIRERKTTINNYILEIKTAIDDYKNSNKNGKDSELKAEIKGTFKRIMKGTEYNQPFTLLHIYIQKYFNEFIANSINSKFSGKIYQYYQDYLTTLKRQ